MKKAVILMITAIMLACVELSSVPALAQRIENTHSCVLMKFVNKTRFKKLAPEEKLSDLVMEKLVASGKFNLKEIRPIDAVVENELYNANTRSERLVNEAKRGNYDALFENEQAVSILEAYQGQIISPEQTAAIGKKHGAEYLIQGTILNVSMGKTEDRSTSVTSGFAGIMAGVWGGDTGRRVAGVLCDTKKIYSGSNIQCELRVIKAANGEIVWHDMITAASKQEKIKIADLASAGTDELSMNLYEMALDQAAQKIVDELLADVDEGEVF
ncbi:hypothetical protein [Anaerovibrio sp.]|uniref:hypothetical protein n=1 Tax=Anaerovibrio sp. TaxID=1872532 RepID=UPI00388E18E8